MPWIEAGPRHRRDVSRLPCADPDRSSWEHATFIRGRAAAQGSGARPGRAARPGATVERRATRTSPAPSGRFCKLPDGGPTPVSGKTGHRCFTRATHGIRLAFLFLDVFGGLPGRLVGPSIDPARGLD